MRKKLVLILMFLLSISLIVSPVSATTPAFHTDPATVIGDSTATLNGDLTDLGGLPGILCNFEYGLTTAYGSTTPTDNRTSPGVFSIDMIGLTSGITYHYRAKITYGGASYYGADEAFATTTSGGLASPDTLNISKVYVYKDYVSTGDRLYMIVYKLVYTAGDPPQDVTDFFEITMTSGGVLKAKIRPNMWGYRVVFLYQAFDLNLIAWGAPCVITLKGTTSQYGLTPPESVYTLTAGDWIDDKSNLITNVISVADSIGAFYSVALTDYTAMGKRLSDTLVNLDNTSLSGAELFNIASDGLLREYSSNLYKVSVTYLEKPVDDAHPQTMRTATSIDARWGVGSEAKLDDLGSSMLGGISGKNIYLLLWLALMLLAASFFAGQSPTLSGAVAAIVGVVGAYMGADLWIILGIAGMLLAFMSVFDYFKNT